MYKNYSINIKFRIFNITKQKYKTNIKKEILYIENTKFLKNKTNNIKTNIKLFYCVIYTKNM